MFTEKGTFNQFPVKISKLMSSKNYLQKHLGDWQDHSVVLLGGDVVQDL